MSSVPAVPLPAAPPTERPLAVTVIGWVWIVYAGAKLLGGIWALLAWRLAGVQQFFSKPGFPAILPLPLIEKAMGGFGVAVTARIVFANGVLVTASALLRLRPWARAAIQVLCWLGLCYVIVFTIVWAVVWRRASLDGSVRFLGLSIALGVLIVLGLAFVSIIRALRSHEVRRAFGGGSA